MPLTEGNLSPQNYKHMISNVKKDRAKFNVSGEHPQFGPNNPQAPKKGKLRHRAR